MQPFEEVYRLDDPPQVDVYRIAVAKVRAGDSQWRRRVKEFTTFAKDLVFDQEFQDISHVPEQL